MSGVVRKQGTASAASKDTHEVVAPKQVRVSAQVIDRCAPSEEREQPRSTSYISDDVEIPPLKVLIVSLPDAAARCVELFCSDAIGLLSWYRRGADVIVDNASERVRSVHFKWIVD